MATLHFSRGPWRAEQISIRGHRVWAVKNSRRDPVAIVYTGESDARLMASSLRQLGSLKHLLAIVRMHEGELRASEKAKYAAAQALVKEIEG